MPRAIDHADHGAVESNAHLASGTVEFVVAGARQHDVVHRRARYRRRHQAAHQQARDRRVAVREMVDVGLVHLAGRLRIGRQRDAGKARVAEQPRIERGYEVGGHAEEIQRSLVQVRDGIGAQSPVLAQEIRVGNAGEVVLAGRVVREMPQRHALRRVQLEQLPARLVRHRKVRNELLERTPVAAIGRDVVTDPVRRVAGDQRVAAEAVAIEEAGARQVEARIERPVEVLAEAVGLDPERLHQCSARRGRSSPREIAAPRSRRSRSAGARRR